VSAMRDTMARQPADVAELLADPAPAERAAGRLAGRRVLLVGTGTSYHAAHHGAWFLRAAGLEAWAVSAMDAALHGPRPSAGDALVALSHTGETRYVAEVLRDARTGMVPAVTVGAKGKEGVDLPTVEPETSSAYTASHVGALTRLAQVAVALGAPLGDLGAVPEALAAVLDGPSPAVRPPSSRASARTHGRRPRAR
jgi:glutamine---fructose-6-phosphate transaminase (isomerizing)